MCCSSIASHIQFNMAYISNVFTTTKVNNRRSHMKNTHTPYSMPRCHPEMRSHIASMLCCWRKSSLSNSHTHLTMPHLCKVCQHVSARTRGDVKRSQHSVTGMWNTVSNDSFTCCNCRCNAENSRERIRVPSIVFARRRTSFNMWRIVGGIYAPNILRSLDSVCAECFRPATHHSGSHPFRSLS